jgi:hypothetical protein
MGHECAQSYQSGAVQQWEELQSAYNIVLDNVMCAEVENATFAQNCNYSTSHNCGHSEDIFLVCASGEQI